MTKNLSNDSVGDNKSPALKPQGISLREGADQAYALRGEPSPTLKVQSATASLQAAAARNASSPPAQTCQQAPWLSFFFDGTGNNLDADVGSEKHSNVAKLYRVHIADDAVKGIYRIYIPGVGTYYRDVGDDGGGKGGLVGGHLGDVRLERALELFDNRLSKHLALANSPGNKIIAINVALFGFSRGAALARAFANKLLKERCVLTKKGWCLKKGNHPLRIRFMGLFDTVASVGLAMSSNTVGIIDALRGPKRLISERLSEDVYEDTRPDVLAFSEGAVPGADPAPGRYNGHQGWGGYMAIPHMVEHVRHFVAAHEVRNSFPVDSVSEMRDGKLILPSHFHEAVYPGVHSDVGGSYRPSEGGRSADRREKLGLIPLHHMYQYAVENGVPLLGKGAWEDLSKRDFEMSSSLVERYNYYLGKLKGLSNLGHLFNAHMAMYFSWRFRSIRLKQQGNRNEADTVARVDKNFRSERAALDKEIERLEEKDAAARRAVDDARQSRSAYIRDNHGKPKLTDLPKYEQKIRDAQGQWDVANDTMLRAKARRDALPNMSEFTSMVEMYDAQLIADAKEIRKKYTERGFFGGAPNSALRNDLRPHYKALIDAYENEFIHNKGLKDETIIAFFDNYVHDSLAGFAKDATLPSDPRVIYLGGNEKFKYASVIPKQPDEDVRYASALESRQENVLAMDESHAGYEA